MSDSEAEEVPKAVYLGSVTLTGYRAFHDGTRVSFMDNEGKPAQWSILLGENGTSKTGVLQAIAAASPFYNQHLQLDKNGVPGGWTPHGTDGSQWLRWWATNRPRNRETSEASVAVNLDFCASNNGREEAVATDDGGFSQLLTKGRWSAEATFGKNAEGQPTATINHATSRDHSFKSFKLFTYAANRLIADGSKNSPFHRMGHALFSGYDALDSPEKWIVELDHMQHLEAGGDRGNTAVRAFEQAKRCLLEVLPDVEDIKILRTGVSPESGAKVRAQFKCPYGWVFFEELGLGYQSIASWSVDLLYQLHSAYPDLEKPETGNAVVLIDEFDLHLHPKWQMTLMERLGNIFTNTQFIVTAHSPLMIQAAGPDANIVVFDNVVDDAGVNWVAVDPDPIRVQGWRLDQIAASDLFGLESTRAPKYSALFRERSALVGKGDRTPAENKRLHELTERIEREAPPSISSEASDVISRLLEATSSKTK